MVQELELITTVRSKQEDSDGVGAPALMERCPRLVSDVPTDARTPSSPATVARVSGPMGGIEQTRRVQTQLHNDGPIEQFTFHDPAEVSTRG